MVVKENGGRNRRFGVIVGVVCALGLTVPGPGFAQQAAVEKETTQREIGLESINEGVSFGNIAHSPAGGTLLFMSNRSGTSKIWLMDDDGTEARLLLDDGKAEAGPVWSSDGEEIAFRRTVGGQADVWRVAADGSGLRRVTDDSLRPTHLAWSPEGDRIAFLAVRDEHQDLHLVEIASGEVTRLTEGANPWDEYRFGPVWSPDGGRIAYVSNRSDYWHQDLWMVDVASGEHRKISTDVDVMTSPVWSPDGAHIAFNAVQKHEFWWGDQSDIYLVDTEDGSVAKLAMNQWVSDRNGGIRLVWGPDGSELYFRYEWEGDANLWRVSAEGGVATKVTYEEGSFGNFSVSPDGRSVVYARSTPVRDDELTRVDLEGGSPEALTEWAPRYDGVEAPERVTFRSTDGTYILGYLYLPPDFDPAGSYPTLVEVHGGGNNAYGNSFHVLEHLLAHEGFVVLAIEYRGSAGHGRAFQRLSLGDWAGEQGWDAVAAARWLRSRSWSNGKVGIYGGSYGGIMSLAAVTRTSEPFDAVAPYYGIYDWATAYEHGDYLMRFWIIEGHLGFKPGEHPELYERTATLRHLDRVDRDLPFLVAHGEEDRRAPFQQSVELVEALEARGNPVEFHAYPGEGHGFRQPDHRLDAYGRLIAFFEEHLVGSQ